MFIGLKNFRIEKTSMILKLYFTFLLIKLGDLWSIGSLCPTETQHRFINNQRGLLQLYCNAKGNYSQTTEVLDLNELMLNQEELRIISYYTITVQVEKKTLTKVIAKYNRSISQINIPKCLKEITLFNNKIDRIENVFFSGLTNLDKLRLY